MRIWTLSIVLIFLMSVLDGIVTWFAVTGGLAREINPIMSTLLKASPTAFFTVKILCTVIGMSLLYWARDHKAAKIGIAVCFLFYAAVMAVHAQILT